MIAAFNDLQRILNNATPRDLRLVAMRGFARELDWTPSYEFEGSFGVDAAEDHIVVEHGLDTSAVITFLKPPYSASALTERELRSLLSISYNNLVEWHLFVSQTDIRQVNNLSRASKDEGADRVFFMSPETVGERLSAAEVQHLRTSRDFQKSQRGCDDALMDTIVRWKRLLKADYPNTSNSSLSTLFNSIIFVRGCEDRKADRQRVQRRGMLDMLSRQDGDNVRLSELLSAAMVASEVDRPLSDFVDINQLDLIDPLDKATAENLLRDFYLPRDSQYDFNFALMSKHALSRIYERYIALFDESDDEHTQTSLFNSVPKLISGRKGSIYTPQFIAGFFSRYIRDNTTPRSFRSLKYVDPACGSGIFLRTLLELQSNPNQAGVNARTIQEAFANAQGVDRDPNAVAATKLSLSLLHLAATGSLPASLPLEVADAMIAAKEGRIPEGQYDAVLTNPPYIKHEHLSSAERENYAAILGADFKGRTDSYLAFVMLALQAVGPDGIACMVLPQVFLNADNAESVRREISSKFSIRCLIDLSAVNVFDGVGAYSILLIVQRRQDLHAPEDALVAQITDFVGPALQACLEGRFVDGPYHKVFPLPQDFFERKEWNIIDPAYLEIERKLADLPRLSSYAGVSQGFVTGADDVFIVDRDSVPKSELSIFLSYLPDKEIRRFGVPSGSQKLVFYPYIGTTAVDEQLLARRFPNTWAYLNANRVKLERRGPVVKGSTPWWRPERPREPNVMRVAKIVTPHLALTPRFGIDTTGDFGVSRSPFIVAKSASEDPVLLSFLLAVLNSSLASWYLRTHAPKYANGYSRIESNLLKNLPIPDLRNIPLQSVQRLVTLVDQVCRRKHGFEEEIEIDRLVGSFYGFSDDELAMLTGRPSG